MKGELREKTTREKIIYVTMWVLRITFCVCLVYLIFEGIKTGELPSTPLVLWLLVFPVGIYNIVSARNRHQGSEEDRKKFNKIVIRSVILAPIILAVFLTITVWIMLKTR